MFDKARVENMLDHMRDMDPKMWDQKRGYLTVGKRCWTLRSATPACAGAHAAFGLGLEPATGRNKVKQWGWHQGAAGIADALGIDAEKLNTVLTKNGASNSPFNIPVWNRYLYDVFRDTVHELTGYEHMPADIHDFPISFDGHALAKQPVEECIPDTPSGYGPRQQSDYGPRHQSETLNNMEPEIT